MNTFRRVLPLAALTVMTGSPNLSAQRNYATPYTVTTLAVAAYDAQYGRIDQLTGLTVDGAGNVYVADAGNSIIQKITPDGRVSTVAGVARLSGDIDGPTSQALLYDPASVAVDGAGNVYFSEPNGNVIRKISSDGLVSILAGVVEDYYSVGMKDGVGSAARFKYPDSIATDAAGNMYVTDSFTVRKVTSSGIVTTVAGHAETRGVADGKGGDAFFYGPYGLAVDRAGNVFVADATAVRKIAGDGTVTTVAGKAGLKGDADGPASAARFSALNAIAVDGAGNLYVTDGSMIRKISADGVVTTLAGTPAIGSADGTGAAAGFGFLRGIAVDASGNLYVTDTANHAVRKAALTPPVLTGPTDVSGVVGEHFTAVASFSGAPTTYQATGLPPGLSLDPATGVISGVPTVAGTYAPTLRATNGVGTGSASPTLTIFSAGVMPGRLVNLSVRAGAGMGNASLIAGLVVGGAGTSGSLPLLLRGVGPALTGFGVPSALADPSLDFNVQTSVQPIAHNDNWGGDPQIASVANAIGAFPFPDAASKDAALLLSPASGVYSMKITGAAGSTGTALAEIYDASGAAHVAAMPRLLNVSVRTPVGSGDAAVIAGFVIDGGTSRTVLIRAIGPSLAGYGVDNVLADPQLELTRVVNGGTESIAINNDWEGSPRIAAFAAAVGAFSLDGPTSKDAALLVTLPPGIYSAKASGVDGLTGVALVEIYEVP